MSAMRPAKMEMNEGAPPAMSIGNGLHLLQRKNGGDVDLDAHSGKLTHQVG